MISFVDMLELGRRLPGVGAAIIDPGGRPRSFDELWTDTHRLADSLVRRGLGPNARIAILGTDSYEYIVAMLASLRLGAPYFPINFRLAPAETRQLLHHCRPDVIFVDDRYVGHVDGVSGALVVSMDDGGRGDTDMRTLIQTGRDSATELAVADEDVVAICYTSGTTGTPKGVMQSQRSMKTEFWRHGLFPPSPGDVRYSASPMFHVAGHRMIFTHLARGCTSVIATQFDAVSVAAMIQRAELSGAFLVPTMLDQVLRHLEDTEGGALPLLLYGGSAIHPSLLGRVLSRLDSRVYNLFGSTESGMVTVLTAEDHRRAHAGSDHLLGSIGRPATGVDVRLCTPDGQPVAPGEVGEIVCRTDGAFSGYLDLPGPTDEVLRDGWLWTGDLARIDADGYLYYAGRSRELIVRGGENVYPFEVEAVLTTIPGVRDAAVIGVPDEAWGEVVVAVLEVTGSPPSSDQLREHCRARLGAYKVPSEFVVMPSLPRSAAGKVAKNELRAELTSVPTTSG